MSQEARSPLVLIGAAVLGLFIVAGIVFAILSWGGQGKPISSKPVEPVRRKGPSQQYAGATRDQTRAQALNQVDFTNPDAVRSSARIMKAASRLERIVLINKLKDAGTPEAVAALDDIATDLGKSDKPEEDLRGHAIGALVYIDSAEAWTAIEKLASSEDDQVRAWVATSLGYSRNPRSQSLLSGFETDESKTVRENAKQALLKIKAGHSKQG